MTRNETTKSLRDAALTILRLRGHFHIDRDAGVASYRYSNDQIRIQHDVGMPSMVDIWQAGNPKPVFIFYWFAGADARFETIAFRPGDWQGKLLDLAAAPVRLKARG